MDKRAGKAITLLTILAILASGLYYIIQLTNNELINGVMDVADIKSQSLEAKTSE